MIEFYTIKVIPNVHVFLNPLLPCLLLLLQHSSHESHLTYFLNGNCVTVFLMHIFFQFLTLVAHPECIGVDWLHLSYPSHLQHWDGTPGLICSKPLFIPIPLWISFKAFPISLNSWARILFTLWNGWSPIPPMAPAFEPCVGKAIPPAPFCIRPCYWSDWRKHYLVSWSSNQLLQCSQIPFHHLWTSLSYLVIVNLNTLMTGNNERGCTRLESFQVMPLTSVLGGQQTPPWHKPSQHIRPSDPLKRESPVTCFRQFREQTFIHSIILLALKFQSLILTG